MAIRAGRKPTACCSPMQPGLSCKARLSILEKLNIQHLLSIMTPNFIVARNNGFVKKKLRKNR